MKNQYYTATVVSGTLYGHKDINGLPVLLGIQYKTAAEALHNAIAALEYAHENGLTAKIVVGRSTGKKIAMLNIYPEPII